MPATLDHDRSSALVVPEDDPVALPDVSVDDRVDASYSTLVAFAVATTLLLAAILGMWWAGGPLATG